MDAINRGLTVAKIRLNCHLLFPNIYDRICLKLNQPGNGGSNAVGC